MLKKYLVNGKEYQYEEGEQPEGAVELNRKKAVEPPVKAVKQPRNKSRKAVKTK